MAIDRVRRPQLRERREGEHSAGDDRTADEHDGHASAQPAFATPRCQLTGVDTVQLTQLPHHPSPSPLGSERDSISELPPLHREMLASPGKSDRRV
jgi:hypothetical protein